MSIEIVSTEIGRQVLIMRRSPEFMGPGVVTGTDKRGKIVVRRLNNGKHNGQEFKAPPELLKLGYAQSKKGHLRFALIPMSPEARLFMADRQQV